MKTTVALILQSPVPIVTLWGEKGVMIYNDAYARFAGGRHPQILGKDVLDGWPEAADWNRIVMEKVFIFRRRLCPFRIRSSRSIVTAVPNRSG